MAVLINYGLGIGILCCFTYFLYCVSYACGFIGHPVPTGGAKLVIREPQLKQTAAPLPKYDYPPAEEKEEEKVALEWSDYIDILAIDRGDPRRTRSWLKLIEKHPEHGRWTKPDPKTVQEAIDALPEFVPDLLTATFAAYGNYPRLLPGESQEACKVRLTKQFETDVVMWRRAILNRAEFYVRPWMSLVLAQDAGWRDISNLDLHSQYRVPGEHRVFIYWPCTPECGREGEFVLYPEAIDRSTKDRPVPFVEIWNSKRKVGEVERETLRRSGWKIGDGWARTPTPVTRGGSSSTSTGRSAALTKKPQQPK